MCLSSRAKTCSQILNKYSVSVLIKYYSDLVLVYHTLPLEHQPQGLAISRPEKPSVFFAVPLINWSFIEDGTMVSPTVFARRCLCYLMSNKPQEALGDAMQAQVVSPEWPTAFYLQAAALFSLGMDKDACETLKDGSSLESKKQNNRN
ncbi:hypothetical protein F2Q68_00022077 [Brassica cretica]|uniref:Serine/threonine-protein kinase BSK n=1 Tax=Brassica cretica TaxID=69181 RepID=A0A8S9FN79_BRACR|nr:hypothetical protein F2Q68_00022077 [Brassica cretica]